MTKIAIMSLSVVIRGLLFFIICLKYVRFWALGALGQNTNESRGFHMYETGDCRSLPEQCQAPPDLQAANPATSLTCVEILWTMSRKRGKVGFLTKVRDSGLLVSSREAFDRLCEMAESWSRFIERFCSLDFVF